MRIKHRTLMALTCLLPLTAWADPVNINTADARTIAKELKGIGVARAQAIVAYRTQHGPFKSPDDLGLVKGIAQKVIDQNRANIRVDGRAEAARGPAPASKAESGKVPPPKSAMASDSPH
jgi:competence protein ComEA